MKNNDGRQEYGIFLDNTQLRASANESKNMLRGIGDSAVAESSRIDNAYKKVAGATVALFSAAAIKQFGMELIDITGKFQTFQAVLTNTLQSPAKAKQSMMMLQEFAATTPFQVDALTGAFVKLANQGFVPTYAQMIKLGDLASSTGKGFDQLAEAIIDAQTGEFERLKEFGIRASKEGDQVTFTFKEQQTQVDFTASSIRDYVLSLGELKGVQGSNAEIAKTLTGQVSNLQDGITQMMNEIGQSSEGVLSGMLSGTSLLVENYQEIGRVLGVLIATYGAYKAAVIATMAVQNVVTNTQYSVEITELTKLLPLKQDSADADIKEAVASGRLTQAKAEQLVAIRAEVQAELERLKVKEKILVAQVAEATKEDALALKQALNAERRERAARQELSQAVQSGNAQKIRRAEIKLTLAEEELNIALKNKEVTANNLATASNKAKSASTAFDTMQTKINAASSLGAAKAKNIFTAATMRLTTAFKSLKLAFASNPIGMIITLLTTAVSAMYMFGNETKVAAGSIGEFSLKLKQEKSTFEELKQAIKQTSEGTKERSDVIKLINERYPSYLSNMLTEKNSTEDIITALTIANGKMVENIKLKLKTTQLEGVLNKQLEKESEFVNAQVDYFKNSNTKTPEQIALFTNKMAAFVEKAREGKVSMDDVRNTLIAFGEDSEKDVKGAIISSDGRLSKKLRALYQWSRDIKEAADEAGNSKQVLDELLKTDTIPETGTVNTLPAGIDRKASEKSISDQVKNSEARIEAERKLKQALVDVAFDTEQAMIDVKAEGFDKQMAQIKLNYDKKLVAIELWEREQRKVVEEAQKATFVAKGGKENDFKFNATDPTFAPALTDISKSADAQREAASRQSVDAEKKLLDDLKAQWQGWGDEYQQIEDRITKVKVDAAKARSQINDQFNAGKINLGEASIALGTVDGGEEEQLENLNSQKTKLTASWRQVFRDLQGMSRNEVEKLIDEINEQLANKELAPADASALLEQLDKAKEYSVGLDPFSSWVDSLGDVKTATKGVELARKKVAQTNLTGSEKEKVEAEQALQEAQELLVSAKERRATSASKSLGDISAVAGATSDLLGAFGVESPAVDGVVSALGSLASIDFMNPISIITGGLKAITSLIGGIFGETDKKKEKEIQQLQGKIDALEKSYETLGKAIDKAYSSDASQLIDQSNEMLEKQKELIKLQIAEEEQKKKSDDGKIDQWKKQLEELDQTIADNEAKAVDVIFGADVQSAIDDFASAYMDAWASGEDRAGAQKDVVKKMIRGIIQEMLKSDIKGTVEKMRNQIKGFMSDDVLSDSELSQIDRMGDEVGRIMEERGKIYDRILKDDKPKEQNENSLTGQIRATMTEQTAAEFGGIWRGQSDKLLSIDSTLTTGFASLVEMARNNALIEANTRRTADNTDGLTAKIDATNSKLDQVIKNTKPDNGTI